MKNSYLMSEYTVSYDEFISQVRSFAARSDELGDGWLYCEVGDASKQCSHLKKTVHLETALGRVKAEYVVSYDISYAVPLLSFNVWRSTGALLTLEEVGKLSQIRMGSRKELYSAVTQQEHRVLRRPYFTVHPCATGRLLAAAPEPCTTTLITFLSVMAPLVGLPMSLQYGATVKMD